MKPVGALTQFQNNYPYANLVSLDANFTALFSALNDSLTYSNYLLDTSATPNTINVAFATGIAVALTAGTQIQFRCNNTNTGATQINLSSLGLVNLVNPDGSAMSSGQLQVNGIYQGLYDGTNFQLVGSWINVAYARTSAEVTAGVIPTNYAFQPGDVRRYGASTALTDNSAAFTTAFSCNTLVTVPAGIFLFTAGVVVPGNVCLQGACCLPQNPNPQGTVLSFANAVAACVTLGGSGAVNQSGALKQFTVFRTGGAPPANSVGVLVQNVDNVILREVYSVNHDICFEWKGTVPYGISAHCDKLFSGMAQTVHILVDTWAELYIDNSRFGMNGSGDYNATAFIRIQGGQSGTAGGPNTLTFTGCHFNQGANTPNYFCQFINLGAGGVPGIDAGEFKFTNCHIESALHYFDSDSTWNVLQRLVCVNNFFNNNAPVFVLNNATQLADCEFIANEFVGTLTLAQTTAVNISGVSFVANRFVAAVSFTSSSGSTLNLRDNFFGAGLTVAGSWSSLSIGGGTLIGGNFSSTATGTIDFSGPVTASEGVATIANGGNFPLRFGSGLIIVTENTAGNTGIYSCGGGSVALISPANNWVAPTTTPAAGKLSVAFSGTNYTIYNNQGASEVVSFNFVGDRGVN